MRKSCLMIYKVIAISSFEKELKQLAKKRHSLKAEFIQLVESLQTQPEQGTSLGSHCYKIRPSIAKKERKNRWSKSDNLCEIIEYQSLSAHHF